MKHMIRRRSFLKGIPAAVGLAALATANGRAQEYRMRGADIKLGVASYSFRKFSRAKAIEMTKQLGTPYLNVKDFHLALTSTPEEIDAANKEFVDAGIVLVGCGNVSFQKDDEADMRSKFVPKLEKFVKEYDIKIAVHNHGPEDKHFPTPQSVLAVVKNMDPRCGLCIDIGHTSRAGADIVAFFF